MAVASGTAGSLPRRRNPERSRAAILAAAERLFAARGFDRVSLAEIAAEAGLSRATPSYFFGSKEQLYLAVLEAAFADRQAATAAAVAPIVRWSAGQGGLGALRRALAAGVSGYMRFLLARPSFVSLISREELDGGVRLRSAHRNSTALTDAFTAVRAVARRRGLRSFAVDDAVLLWVSLTFGALAHANTLLVAIDRDLRHPEALKRHVRFTVAQLMALLS